MVLAISDTCAPDLPLPEIESGCHDLSIARTIDEACRIDQPQHQEIHEIRTRSAVSRPLLLKPPAPTAATNRTT